MLKWLRVPCHCVRTCIINCSIFSHSTSIFILHSKCMWIANGFILFFFLFLFLYFFNPFPTKWPAYLNRYTTEIRWATTPTENKSVWAQIFSIYYTDISIVHILVEYRLVIRWDSHVPASYNQAATINELANQRIE